VQILHDIRVQSIGGSAPTGEIEVFGHNLTNCHIVQHKSYTDWPGTEPGRSISSNSAFSLHYFIALQNLLRCVVYTSLL